MRASRPHPDTAVALSSGQISAVSSAAPDATVALPQGVSVGARLALPRIRIEPGALAGRLALAFMLLGSVAVVVFASGGPSALVARSHAVFPTWEAGPLHLLTAGLHLSSRTENWGMSGLLIAMLFAYLVVLASLRSLSARTIVAVVVALHAILLLSPPLLLTDLFNYLGYARLGGLHGLNPYHSVIAQELHDPVYTFTTWHHLHSPYGPLFTAGSYAVARLPLAVAYWLLKAVAVGASLGFLALVWRCARRLGRDPRLALAFVALNPLYLVYAVGGFHNDFLMLLPAMAAIALVLSGRDRSAGAMLVLAVAVKFTAILLLPFLLLAARPWARGRRLLAGAALTALPLIIGYLLLFGTSLPDLSDQSTLITAFSVPNIFVLLLGGGSVMLRLVTFLALGTIGFLLWRHRDWLSAAGWATLALLAALVWLVPWYIAWVLPLAAIAGSRRLRHAALAGTVFLMLTFLPATPMILNKLGFDPLNTSVGQASRALQNELAG